MFFNNNYCLSDAIKWMVIKCHDAFKMCKDIMRNATLFSPGIKMSYINI